MSNERVSPEDNGGMVVAALTTDLGQQIVVESYSGSKYKSSNMSGVSYLQEPYLLVRLLEYNEGIPVDTSSIWLSSNDMRKLMEQLLSMGKR